jgi:hypothetical protein
MGSQGKIACSIEDSLYGSGLLFGTEHNAAAQRLRRDQKSSGDES